MSDTQVPAANVTLIAPDGDVQLTIETPLTARLRVSSVVLRDASKVFAALLGPHFREGQAKRSATSPAKILLPDDNAAAMIDMCKLLHGRSSEDLVSKHILSHRIYNFAVVVDKYACLEPLRFHSEALLMRYLDQNISPGYVGLGRIAAAAYLLNHPRAFHLATKRLIMKTTEPMSMLLNKDFASVVPVTALLFMEQKRNQAQSKISGELMVLGVPECEDCICDSCGGEDADPCDNSDSTYTDAVCKSFNIHSWPPHFRDSRLTISDAIKSIKMLGTLHRDEPSCEHSDMIEKVTAADFWVFIAAVERICKGLCLKCVREGLPDLMVCSVEAHK